MPRTPFPDTGPARASAEAEEAFDGAFEVDDDEAGLEIEDPSEEVVEPPAKPADDVDLKNDQRAAIDMTYTGIDEKSFYEVLLLPRTADAKAIKRAYYRLSKEYHPDKFYRKNLGPYKLKLEVIFNKITEAYRILSDVEARQDYDDLVFGKPEKEEQLRTAPVSEASTTVDFVPAAERKREAARKAKDKARQAVRKKKARPVFMQNFQKQLAQRIAKARLALKAGQEAMEVENWEEASSQFQRAMTLDPRNPKAKMLFRRAQGMHRNTKAESYYRQAQDVLLAEDTKRAAELYQLAVDCKPTKGKYYYDFGKLILEHTLQQKVGLELLRKAVEYEPRNLNYNLALGRVYEELGMATYAQRTFERVLQLDKKNSEATKALRRLR
ncbi:MAG: DnaJ domain-containing protein [Deltaproteobacteria bacterium]|nr:DnaJ domain-containing protein [Deltaproteobacteria bacterium]